MGDDRRRDELPDISGVFQIDENDIPAGLIKKPKEPQRRVSSYRSDTVLSREPEGSGSRRAAASEENRRGYAARQRAEYEEEQRRARSEQRAAYEEENRRGQATRQREDYYARQKSYGADGYAEEEDADAPPLKRQAAQYEARRAYRASRHDDLYADSRREDPRWGSDRRENEYEAEDDYRENNRRRGMTRENARRDDPRVQRQNQSREEALRRQQRQKAMQKRRLLRMLPGILIPALIVIAVIVIVVTLRVNRTPKIVVATAGDSSVENYTPFDAVAVNDPSGTDEDRVYAVFVCNNYDSLGIADGNKVNLVFPDGKTVPGGVTQIMKKDASDPLLELIGAALPQTSVSPEENHVVVVLPDDSSACTEGEKMEAQVVTEASANVLAVPVTALRTEGAQIYVWVYKETGLSKKIERRDVTVGVISAEKAEIREGLKSGEKVVVGSNRKPDELINGMRVRLEEAPVEITAAPAAEG